MTHRPEVGRTLGVDEWAAGEPFCTITCDNGHRRRLIDRVRYADGVASLYTAAARLDDPSHADPGTSAEDNPTNYDTKWRLSCPCGLDVVLTKKSLSTLAKGTRDQGVSKLKLTALAAIVS